jgi:signal transduction histidine kinase
LIFINQRLFERMMENLIYNAIKHNPPGTRISIILMENEENQALRIIVQDNGVGMEESTRNHLFDRFYRGTNTDERLEGTGLGMAIAMQIVQLHDGMITVVSEIGAGTKVCVTLLGSIVE